MKLPRYEMKSEKSLMVFEFISEGTKGKISKLIKFSETNVPDVFNLAFGDKIETTDEIDDFAVSNNGDSEKVLATVVASVNAFTEKHPNFWVYATGSTKSRTRLYQIGISKYVDEIRKSFEIYGLHNGDWKVFRKGVNYESFLVKRK
jgi:uncharacterized membrane protein